MDHLQAVFWSYKLEEKFSSNKPKELRQMITRSLKWPFEETEVLQVTSRIGRQKGPFTIVLSINHM